MLTPVPEPPDGTRIEFEHYTDLYAAWRDDSDSNEAGWTNGENWVVYPGSVPRTWAQMWDEFGVALAGAIVLAPVGVLSRELNEEYESRFWTKAWQTTRAKALAIEEES